MKVISFIQTYQDQIENDIFKIYSNFIDKMEDLIWEEIGDWEAIEKAEKIKKIFPKNMLKDEFFEVFQVYQQMILRKEFEDEKCSNFFSESVIEHFCQVMQKYGHDDWEVDEIAERELDSIREEFEIMFDDILQDSFLKFSPDPEKDIEELAKIWNNLDLDDEGNCFYTIRLKDVQ